MKNFFNQLYTIWCAIVFAGLFILLFPFYFIIILNPKWHHYHYYLNRFWAWLALKLVGISTEFIGLQNLDPKAQYVYCANHFSLLDILSFGFSPHAVVYVGKKSLAKIPLFGYMFRKLHVTVDRSSLKNRYEALQQAMVVMGQNRSLVMFPEGGILSKQIPEMIKFKDGAFRAAIEKQIPLVPVTLPDNWIILPDKLPIRINRRKMRMIFHEPISTVGLNMEDVPALKEQVFAVIDETLKGKVKVGEYQ